MSSSGKGDLSAATQVKVLSPEINLIARGQALHVAETRNGPRVKGERGYGVPGSESVAGKSTVQSELGRSIGFSEAEYRAGAGEATRRDDRMEVGSTHTVFSFRKMRELCCIRIRRDLRRLKIESERCSKKLDSSLSEKEAFFSREIIDHIIEKKSVLEKAENYLNKKEDFAIRLVSITNYFTVICAIISIVFICVSGCQWVSDYRFFWLFLLLPLIVFFCVLYFFLIKYRFWERQKLIDSIEDGCDYFTIIALLLDEYKKSFRNDIKELAIEEDKLES